MIIKIIFCLKYKYFILIILLIQLFQIIIANPNIFKVTNDVTFINYTCVFYCKFYNWLCFTYPIICIVTLTVNCPNKACYLM